MSKEKLLLEHAEILSGKLADINAALSEYLFANLYLFRDKHDYQLIDDSGSLFLSGAAYDGKTFLMPLCDLSGDENTAYLAQLIEKAAGYDMIYPIPENWLDKFPSDKFDVSYTEDDSDYIYEIEKFVSYPGRKLHSKRNLVTQFLRDYKAEVLPLTEENALLAAEVLNKWQNESDSDKEQTDFVPCLEALRNMKKLNQTGQIFLIDDMPKGFVIGEQYNKEYCVVHFAKADSKIKGIYQYMFSVFARSNEEMQCRFINLEQDLGKEGLRAMKKSYQPIKLLHKYRVAAK